ncbi:MAG: T9SS type A sorting domain-containing protein [Ignavibacteria bacterium]
MRLKFNLFIIAALILVTNMSMADNKPLTRSDKASWGAQDGAPATSYAPYNYSKEPSVFTIRLDPGYQTDSYTIGPEIPTLISGFFDYKTNGEANHYLQVDPSNPLLLHSIDVTSDTLEPLGATTRRTEYSTSSDGGASWFNLGNVPDRRSGYPVLKLRNGAGVIGNHSLVNGVNNVCLFVDIAPQAGGFTEYSGTDPFSIWAQIEVLSNGNVGMLSRPQHPPGDFDTIFYQTFNGTTLGGKEIAYISSPPYQSTVGTNAVYQIASNGAGRVTQVFNPVLEDDILFNARVWARTSTDNGATWGALTEIFTPFYENGDDTVATAGGSDLIYKPNTSTWVYSLAATANNTFADGRIYLIRSDGTRSTITTVAAVGGTTTYAQTMSFVFTLDQPALGYSEDGTVLYCVYSVVKPDLGASGYNSRDLYYQRSLDDGTTWSDPIRITNTPDIDECYPSISNYNKGSATADYDLNITYMKDPGVGPTAFGGSAPASRNFQIYRKISNANVVGISNNGIEVKDFSLQQNYPNPFNPTTTIKYNLIKNGFVTLKVFDILGREVKRLVNEYQQPGIKEVNFDASSLPSGIYFYSMNTEGFNDIKKMMLVK